MSLFYRLPPWGHPPTAPSERRELPLVQARRYDPATRSFVTFEGRYESSSHKEQHIRMAAGMLDIPSSMGGLYNPMMRPTVATQQTATAVDKALRAQLEGYTDDVTVVATDEGHAVGVVG